MSENKAVSTSACSVLLALLLACSAAPAGAARQRQPNARDVAADRAPQAGLSWLSSPQISRESVTEALRAISSMAEQDAARQIDALRAARSQASDEGKRAADLLTAVALERKGDLDGALAVYQTMLRDEAETPYRASASYRLQIVEQPNRSRGELEKIYETIAGEPAAEGWFLVSDQWTWSTSRQAALTTLIDFRSDYLSIRLFSFLRSKSLFPAPYAYLFALLVIAIGVKILAMPLHLRAVRLAMQLKRLSPQIRSIQSAYSDDPVTMNQRLAELYKVNGVNVWQGCLVSLIDLIFVVWALVTLRDFSPQMALDGARFWWISDVLNRDLGILAVWTGVTFIQVMTSASRQPEQTAQLGCGVLLSCGAFAAIAWYWQWPAYVMIFWAVLTSLGVITNLLLISIATLSSSGSRRASSGSYSNYDSP